MEYKRFGNKLAIRLDVGDDINEKVTEAVKAEGVRLASVTGIGAVDEFTVGVFDLSRHDYNRYTYTGNHEITSLVGNITELSGDIFCHLHITCASGDGKVVGGHLLSSHISITGEVFVDVIDGEITRRHDDTLNFNRMELSK